MKLFIWFEIKLKSISNEIIQVGMCIYFTFEVNEHEKKLFTHGSWLILFRNELIMFFK